MADYSYRISAGGTAGTANAGATSINAAVADFVANDRMAAGANGRVAANSKLRFLVDGSLTPGADTITGIDTTTNANASVEVDAYSNPFNAAVAALNWSTSFDGLDYGGFSQLVVNNANVLVKNLLIAGSNASGFAPVEIRGTVSGDSSIRNCLVYNSASSGGLICFLDYATAYECVFIATTNAVGLTSNGHTTPRAVHQCTIVNLAGGTSTAVNNLNDPGPDLRNCYLGGYTTLLSAGSWGGSSAGNATSAASGALGTSPIYSVPASTANFNNVTAGAGLDLRVKSGSALAAAAARLATELTDIFGQSRADPATIGAFELVSAGGTAVPVFFHNLRQQGIA